MTTERSVSQKNESGIEDASSKSFRNEEEVVVQDTAKRLAQQGQWRTPPLPAFAACATNSGATSPTLANNLPTTPDEYARMLQEAYKRGAEAGARAQQPRKHTGGLMAGMSSPPIVQCTASPGVPAKGISSAEVLSVQAENPNYGSLIVPTAVSSNSPGEAFNKEIVSVPHSKSMPDMSSYQAALTHVNDEEDKRKKRLARNRASARLRRLKKKNLVDSYEGEVGILERALSKLRSHRWGSEKTDHEALFEALSMERGQQPLTPDKRRDVVQLIVAQQREQVTNLLELQLENWLLCSLVVHNENMPTNKYDSSSWKTFSTELNSDDELSKVTGELKSMLHLSPKQLSLIKESSLGCIHEVQDLLTVDSCLQSIRANQWLLDEGVDEIAGQFTSILNPTQLSKYLLWSDHNAEPIEKLDYVNILPGVGSGPLFEFGVDEGLADGE